MGPPTDLMGEEKVLVPFPQYISRATDSFYSLLSRPPCPPPGDEKGFKALPIDYSNLVFCLYILRPLKGSLNFVRYSGTGLSIGLLLSTIHVGQG